MDGLLFDRNVHVSGVIEVHMKNEVHVKNEEIMLFRELSELYNANKAIKFHKHRYQAYMHILNNIKRF
ncbi:MAG: hypothetical protein ACFFDN_30060 [Candidatus Hodarchaeota archaeon]